MLVHVNDIFAHYIQATKELRCWWMQLGFKTNGQSFKKERIIITTKWWLATNYNLQKSVIWHLLILHCASEVDPVPTVVLPAIHGVHGDTALILFQNPTLHGTHILLDGPPVSIPGSQSTVNRYQLFINVFTTKVQSHYLSQCTANSPQILVSLLLKRSLNITVRKCCKHFPILYVC